MGFPAPEVKSCERLFHARLLPEAIATTTPWPELLERVRTGETLRLTAPDGRTVARIVPPTAEDLTREEEKGGE